MSKTIRHLRLHAIGQSLFEPTTLKAAIRRLAFVQADPIRSPARAQDLILRHRVKDYRAGDLERRYPALDIEEDVLYAYGFLPRPVWQLLHPRNMKELSDLSQKVLATVRKYGRMHPRELEAHFGRDRVVNAWGGYSKATTRALEDLHHRGLLRIAGRENGIRIYEANSVSGQPLPPMERVCKLVMIVAAILAPVPEATLQSRTARYRRIVAGLPSTRPVIAELVKSGELEKQTVDGITYLFPPHRMNDEEAPPHVRFLAPFDPLVWDRRRFEHLWKWPYRFEAYTPPSKRLRGYYAMPLLWRDDIIGWANAAVIKGKLNIDLGYVAKRPRQKEFRPELELEIARLEKFLELKRGI